MDTYLIGLDITKNVFTARAIDHIGKPFRKKLSRPKRLCCGNKIKDELAFL